MGTISEIDALKAIDDSLSALDDLEARNRILEWACKKFSSKPVPPVAGEPTASAIGTVKTKSKKVGSGAKSKSKAKPSLSMVKDLNLKPNGKPSLDDFVEQKKPISHYEKCTVCTYFLKHELNLDAISESHVFTCLKHMKWRIPANLSNTLAYTASQYGWLDTSDLQKIRITTMGENLVEHDLPKKKATKSK
jgi:hypothetical protein